MQLLDKFPIEGGQKDPKQRIIPFLPGKLGWSLLMGWGYPGEGRSLSQEKVGNSTRILAQGGPSNLHVNNPQGIGSP